MQPIDPQDDPIADERIQFHLRNRAAIKEWAAIEKDVQVATHQILVGLIPELELALRDADRSVTLVGQALDSKWPRIAAYRRDWPRGIEPHVAVTLEWTPRVDPAGAAVPYYGIRVQVDDSTGIAIADALRADSPRSLAAKAGFKALTNSESWPVYQNFPATPDWWKNVRAFREDCIGRFASSWRLLSPLVDTAVSSAAIGEGRGVGLSEGSAQG